LSAGAVYFLEIEKKDTLARHLVHGE